MTSIEIDVMSAINPSPTAAPPPRASKRERERERETRESTQRERERLFTQDIFWARVKGFSPWPARLCSVLEAEDLEKKNPLAKRETKTLAKKVMFFGNKRTMGVSFENAMFPFVASTFESRVEKSKLRSDAEYRSAVAEAMLLMERQGEVFDAESALLLQDEIKALKATPLSERCNSCNGTHRSGDLQQCVICEKASVHWSCFRPEDRDVANKQWVCPQCREEEGLSRDYIESSASPSIDSEKDTPAQPEKRPRSSLLSQALSAAEGDNDSLSHTHDDSHADALTEEQLQAMDPKERKRARERERRRRNRERELREKAERERERRRARALEKERERERGTHPEKEGARERDRERVTRASLASTALPSDSESEIESDSQAHTRSQKEPHTHTRPRETDTQADAENAESDSEDACFVCGQGSEVLCCDFPGCKKVYHQMCVVKTLPLPLRMIDKAEDNSNSDHNSVFRSFYHHQSTPGSHTQHTPREEDDNSFVWFCPRHYCASCSALETLPCNWQFTPLPSHLYAQLARSTHIDPQSLGTKNVTSCAKCPLSLCGDCEGNIQHSWGCNVFSKSRRTSSLGPQASVCLNCASPSPSQRLAHILEGAWAKMSRSRLATPFLRPCLPVAVNRHAYSRRSTHTLPLSHTQSLPQSMHTFSPIHSRIDSSSHMHTQSEPHALSPPPHNIFPQTVCRSHALSPEAHITHLSPTGEAEPDVLSLCEHIHDLRYRTRKDFLKDLNVLRNTVIARLHYFLTEDKSKAGNEAISTENGSPRITESSNLAKSIDQHPTYQDLVFAVNTIVEAAHAHLEAQTPLLYEIERAICEEERVRERESRTHAQAERVTQSTNTTGDSTSVDDDAIESKKRRRTSARLAHTQTQVHTDPNEQTHTPTQTNREAEAQLRRVLWRLPVHRRTSLSESERDRLGEIACVSEALLARSYTQTQCAYDNFSVAMTGSHTLIAPRSLHAWAEFVRRGAMPANAIAPDTYSRAPSPADSLSLTHSHSQTDLCSEERVKDAFAEAMGHQRENDIQLAVTDELLAAEMMISMQRRALNETVSLPFPSSSSAYPAAFALSASDRELVGVMEKEDDLSLTRRLGVRELQSPKEDETLFMLQRLQQLTRQTLDLQARLQREYTQRQRRVLVGSETLSLAEAGLVRELALANEHLRWRLSQEQRLSQQQSREKTDLQALVKSQQEKIQTLENGR